MVGPAPMLGPAFQARHRHLRLAFSVPRRSRAGPARSRPAACSRTRRTAFLPAGKSMVDFQMWLVRTFARATPVATMMKTAWGWPAAESVHFIGLSLLVGAIFLFDLRLIGVA